MSQLYFYFDQTRCISCNACVVACKDWNNIKPGVRNYRNLTLTETGSFAKGTTTVYPLVYSCNHCAEPSCLTACPANAIYKRAEDGVVLIDHEKCAGVGDCIKACPYSAIHLENTVHGEQGFKCTFCWDRLPQGKRPSCVMACPQRALDCGTLENLKAKYPDLVVGVSAKIRGFPDDGVGSDGKKLAKPTKPSIAFKVKK